MNRVARVLSLVAASSMALVVATISLECMYRLQIVDFFRPELLSYNARSAVTGNRDERPVCLVMGDSFTAGRENYPSMLVELLPDFLVVNAGVSGSGLIEANLIADRRFQQFRPVAFIYQVYVGNDLFDLRYPVSWGAVSLQRNLYWFVANHLRFTAFLNYRLGQLFPAFKFRSSVAIAPGLVRDDENFAPEKFTLRDRLYLRAEPRLLEDTVLTQGARGADYETFLRRLSELMAQCSPPNCHGYVLVIPHSAQVSDKYLQRAQAIGAAIGEPERLLSSTYPFLQGVRDLGVRNGFEVMSPLGQFRVLEERGVAVYRENDSHLTEGGQRALAEYIASKVSCIARNNIEPESCGDSRAENLDR